MSLNEGSPDCIFDCVAGHLILSMGQFYRDFILNIVYNNMVSFYMALLSQVLIFGIKPNPPQPPCYLCLELP